MANDPSDMAGRAQCQVRLRTSLANAFVSKAVLGIADTVGLIERLAMDKALRRICKREQTEHQLPHDLGIPLDYDVVATKLVLEAGVGALGWIRELEKNVCQ